MSLLSIVQTMCGEIGLAVPVTVFTNSDANILQMLYLVQREGKELAESAESAGYWERLRKQYLLQTTGYGPYTCTVTPGTTTLTALSSTAGIALGQQVYCSGLANDTQVIDVSQLGAGIVGLSQAPVSTVALSGQNVVFAQEAYPFPSDLSYFINQTGWNRSFRWQLLGPVDAQEWQVIKSGVSPAGPRMRYRIFGGQIVVTPVGSSSSVYQNTIALEYVTNQWVATQAAPTIPAQMQFQQDTDVALINEDLIAMGAKWRFLRAKGMSYDDEFEQWSNKYSKAIGRDAMARNLSLNARASGLNLLGSNNIPDTGYGR